MKILNKLKGTKSVSRLKLAAVALLGATLAGSLISGVATLPVYAAVDTSTAKTVAVNGGADIYDATTGKFDQAGLKDLISKTTGYSSYETALSGLGSSVITSSSINSRNGSKDVLVEFGGLQWTVTYVSKDVSGNLIATLWYAGTAEYSMYSANWMNAVSGNYGCDDAYYSSAYGMSYIRSVGLNIGSSYYYTTNNATGAMATADVASYVRLNTGSTQASDHMFALFTMANSEKGIGVVDYLVSPNQVSWQANEYVTGLGGGYRYPNDSYSVIDATAANHWHSRYVSKTFQTREGFADWANDPIWLPSYSETGDNSTAGIWATSVNQRSVYSWLRSSHSNYANYAILLDNAGAYGSNTVVSSYGVRPALHLNLTMATGNDLWEGNSINQDYLDDFISQLSTGGTYDSLAAALSGSNVITAADLRSINANNDVSVLFGGYKWTVTYVSKDNSGNLIATLLFNGTQPIAAFSEDWHSISTAGGVEGYLKASNHYGGSILRAVTLGNGGQYYTATGTTVATDNAVTTVNTTTAKAKTSAFYEFAQGAISSYLVSPNNVSWQQNEYISAILGYGRMQNETLYSVYDNWDTRYPLMPSFQNDPLYYQWGNDKVWLPSLTELGYTAVTGIWHSSDNQIKSTSSTGKSWVRSGSYGNEYHGWVLNSSGTAVSMSVASNESHGVRPAIHLNLTKAAEYGVEENGNEALQNAWNVAVQESLLNSGKQVTFTLTSNWYALPNGEYLTSFGEGIGFEYGTLYVPQGANIILDLNGYALDRSLGSATACGYIIKNTGNLTINDSSSAGTGIITGGMSSKDNGAGLFNTTTGNATINGGNFINNQCFAGGGAAVFSQGKVTVNGGVFMGNSVSGSGGAFVIVGTAEINGGVIRNNHSTGSGGAIYVHTNSTVVINGGEIYNNSNYSSGGAIFVNTNSKTTINAVNIHDNSARTYGGGIYFAGLTLIMNGGEITDNKIQANVSTGSGGAGVCVASGSSFIMNDGLISGNRTNIDSTKTSYPDGGGVNVSNGKFTMNGGKITDNVGNRGGGISALSANASVVINGGEIIDNTAGAQGGGIFSYSSANVTINGGVISGNHAVISGGGVYTGASVVLTMTGGSITGNTLASTAGAGIYVNNITFNFSGGIVSDNKTDAGVQNNAWLITNQKITIKGKLGGANPTWLGVSLNATTGIFTTGYSTAGNSVNDGTKYFFSDASKTVAASGTTELQITSTATSAKSTLAWKVNGTAINNNYYVADYTGAAYTVSTSVAVSGVDQNGRPVSSVANAGVYYFTVASPASYYNSIFILEILGQSISGAEVFVSDAVYSGSALTPNVTVNFDGVTLIQDKDYTVSYANNINAGSATVTVTGIGNYFGSAVGHFTIEKRNLDIRWGDATVEYNGETQAIKAVVEGLLSGDSVNIILYYYQNGEFVTPVDAGTYTVYATLSGSTNYQFADNATTSYTFTINQKSVEVIWSEDSFVYNGSNQAPTAYYTDLDGNKVDLDVNVSGSHADVDTYSATAAFKTDDDASANYALKSATFNYSIEKAGAKLAWGSDSHEFDGSQYAPTFTIEGVNGEDLSSGVSITYWLDGVSLGTDAPANVGKYIARATFADSNYVLVDSNGKVIEYSEFEFSITAAAAPITWDTFSAAYDGNGQAPTFTFDSGSVEVGYTITYKLSGDKEYSEDKPVDAGNYIAKVEFENGNYVEVEHSFTIAKKDVAVAWSGGENYYVSGNPVVYNYLYDGAAHAPAASAKVTVNGDEITLEVTVAGQINVGAAYTATAVLDDNDTNKNFNLTGATHSFNIVKSNVTDIEWFEYGSASPVEDVANTKLAFLQTAVYGLTGPKLTAYGIATVNMPVEGGMQVEITARVPLAVSYSSTSIGYWDFGDYTATAAVANGQSNNYAIASTAKNTTVSFEITDKLLEVVTAEVKWNYGDAEQDSETGIYYWIYDGNPHAPEAKLYIDGVETKTLAIGGRMTDAGKYYAFVLPNEYSIDEQYADCYFEIRPRGVEISWTGFGGSEDIFEWTYDGLPHAPVAAVKDSGGLICTLGAIKSYTDAGNYTANAVCLSSNFTITSGATQQFTINRLTLDASKITWISEGSKEDFVWVADGKDHAPVPSLTVTINGVDVDIAFTVVGATSVVGTHTAYATLSADTANANFILTGAEKSFIIETSTIQYIYWEGVNGSLTDFEWTYDGEEHFPKAYYWDDNSEKVYLNVIGGRTDAGEYIAYITDNTGLSANMTKAFSIVKQEISVDWSNSPASAVYDGSEHSPVASLVNGQGDKLVVGVDYTVTCFVTAGTYTAQVYLLNKNYVLADDVEGFKFTITPAQIAVVWHGNTTDGEFYWYYNEQDHAPTITYKAPAGVDVEIEVIGGDSYVGTYTAYAVCTNANFTLTNAEQTFEIKPYAITVTWVGNEDNNYKFEWEYNGKEHKPDATYIDWNGYKKDLEVRGAQIDASTYTAVAVIPENCAFRYTDGVEGSGTHTFTITPKVITGVVWSKEKGGANSDEFEWEYDGEVKRPYARTLVDSLELTVTGSATDAGEYEAKAELPNENNYVFRSDVANTVKFTITPKEIEVIWYGKDGVKGDYTWNYTGEIIAPTANFEGVDNKTYDVPVSGGASAAGEHTAEAVNVFANYSFTELSSKQVFTINKEQLIVTWNGTAGADGNYTYTFNGKVQMPDASAKTSADAAVNCSYTITDENDNEVGAVINAGTYKVSIVPANTNYVIAAEDATITVVITKLTVKVEWSTNTTLLYNGEEQAPAAWYYDADKQAIALDVTGMEKEVGTGYTATADFSASDENSANYELDASTDTKTFQIVTNSGDGNEWVWTPTPGWSDDLASSDTDDSSGD